MKTIATKPTTTPALPKPVRAADLKRPSYRTRAQTRLTAAQRDQLQALGIPTWQTTFDLWHTHKCGWVIPTLLIRSSRRSAFANRTYAVGVADELQYAVGAGPHVTAQHTVYLRRSNFERLLPLVQLMMRGEVASNEIRDSRSTRALRGRRRFSF